VPACWCASSAAGAAHNVCPVRHLLVLVPTLATVALAAGEPLTATAWDVRKDALELIDELNHPSADPGDLLSRAQSLIAAHGGDLIAISPSEAVPISDAVAARMLAAGLSERFARDAGPAAERRLEALLASGGTPPALADFARSVPGTQAAHRAWRRAADLAWDFGRLRLYLEAATGAGETADALRKPRLAAARQLLASLPAALPDTLDALEMMWRVESANPQATAVPAAGRRRENAAGNGPGHPSAGICGAGAIAITDGAGMVVVDHLVGSQLGGRIVLGDRVLPPHVARPEATPDGAVAVGLANGRIVLTCVDGSGTERWRRSCGTDGADAVSAPLLVDGAIAVAYRIAGADRLELRLLALSARDGAPLWDTAIGQLAAPRWGADNLAAPSLARHARGMTVCSNAGSFALVGTDGAIRRLWSYPTRPDLEMDGARKGRRGLSAGDGTTAIATPADHAGLVLVLGPDDNAPRAYRGDGADGDVLAVAGGDALIAGRQVALVDTSRLRLRWTAALRLSDPQGMMGDGSALVAGTDQIALLDRRDGHLISGRALGDSSAVTAADGVLVLADANGVRGFGDAGAFLARLREAAAKADSDPRPHAALGAVLAGRGETDAALAAWGKALELGAGPGIAERMARLLRVRVDAGGTAALDQLAALTPYLPGMIEELRLWRARLAETAGDRVAAATHYAAAMAAPDRLLPMADGMSISIHLLAAAGAQRCGTVGAWPGLTSVAPPTATPQHAWSATVRVHGRAVLAGDVVSAFADGLLQGWRISDGSALWQRKPQRALLGVRPWRDVAEDGVAISVLPGSAGESAGLQDGDVLLSLNGTPLRDFDRDLRAMVMGMGGGAAFTFEVRSKTGVQRRIQGRLGGEPLEPLASDGSIILARTTMPLAPARTDLRIFAIDAATGTDLWSQALSQNEERQSRSLPLLAGGGIVVAADGPDLVGIERSGTVQWRLTGRADLLAKAQVLGRCLWMPNPTGDSILLDPQTGAELARIPGTAGEDPVLADGPLAVRGTDGRIAIWDLANGRLRCRSADPGRPLALRGDALLALDARNRPVVIDLQTGAVRRSLTDLPVEAQAVGDNSLHLALAGPERRSLVSISLDGMVIGWSIDLPPGLEVESMRAAGDGLLAVLREGTRTWTLLLDGRGVPLATTGWPTEPGGDASPAGRAALVVDQSTIRALLPSAPPAQTSLRCLALDRSKPLHDAVAAGLPKLAWSSTAAPAIAVAKHDVHLVIAVRRQDADLALRLCDSGGSVAIDAARALVNATGTRLAIPGSWTMAEQWTVPDPAGGPDIAMSAWAPLPSRAPGTPVAVLLGDRDGQPWWLSAGWNRITDPP
jgi:outer membrane protein assembly factor BamB